MQYLSSLIEWSMDFDRIQLILANVSRPPYKDPLYKRTYCWPSSLRLTLGFWSAHLESGAGAPCSCTRCCRDLTWRRSPPQYRVLWIFSFKFVSLANFSAPDHPLCIASPQIPIGVSPIFQWLSSNQPNPSSELIIFFSRIKYIPLLHQFFHFSLACECHVCFDHLIPHEQ